MLLNLLFLDAGILISSSVLKQCRDKLEWCVHNSFSDSHSENLGRCVAHSTRLKCANTIQVKFYIINLVLINY